MTDKEGAKKVEGSNAYCFSIQPFWDVSQVQQPVRDESIAVSEFIWSRHTEVMSCVPGNGQIAIMITPPDAFSGTCYGVADCRRDIPLYGMKDVFFARFSPGTFSAICGIPATEIPAEGADISLLFSGDQLERLREAAADQHPTGAHLRLFEKWQEASRAGSDRSLAEQAVQLIRRSGGAMRMRQLEQETLYSARRLQDVVTRQVGISPKQLCRQTRFQNALKLLRKDGSNDLNCAQAAQQLGYSDQAHFNREFKAFCGMCPSKFLNRI